MSQNGQIVIPSEIRKDAGLKASTKFLVFNENGNILLKQINKEKLREEMELINRIMIAEEQIKRGEVTIADTDMSVEEIDKLLRKK